MRVSSNLSWERTLRPQVASLLSLLVVAGVARRGHLVVVEGTEHAQRGLKRVRNSETFTVFICNKRRLFSRPTTSKYNLFYIFSLYLRFPIKPFFHGMGLGIHIYTLYKRKEEPTSLKGNTRLTWDYLQTVWDSCRRRAGFQPLWTK